MNHDREAADVIDLGKVSDETLGPEIGVTDEEFGHRLAGLSND